jgi:hypothetical protein
MHESWQKALQPEFKKPYFTKVMDVSRIRFRLTDLVAVENILASRTYIAHCIPFESVFHLLINVYLAYRTSKLVTYTLGQDLRLSMKSKLLFSAK